MADPKVVVPPPPEAIYASLVAVSAELAKTGIAKDRQNVAQNFRFRGIDDVMNAVSPILAKHDVVFLMTYEDYPDVDRVTGKGTTLIYSKVRGTFSFVSAKDGSRVEVTTVGVAMDSGDKATNKAMSASLKYALLQTFLIPTESTDDADATTPDENTPKAPEGFDAWFGGLGAIGESGFEALKDEWRNSSDAWREFAMKHRTEAWDAVKKKATAITNAAKKKAATP